MTLLCSKLLYTRAVKVRCVLWSKKGSVYVVWFINDTKPISRMFSWQFQSLFKYRRDIESFQKALFFIEPSSLAFSFFQLCDKSSIQKNAHKMLIFLPNKLFHFLASVGLQGIHVMLTSSHFFVFLAKAFFRTTTKEKEISSKCLLFVTLINIITNSWQIFLTSMKVFVVLKGIKQEQIEPLEQEKA